MNIGGNIQQENVGNLGDIIKHAALVELAKLIQSRNPDDRINYLDTHTYLLESECANRNWFYDVSRLLADAPGYANYVSFEKASVNSGRYLCSCGLALAVLRDPRLFLAESDGETRRELDEQLRAGGIRPQMFYTDMKAYAFLQTIEQQGALLAIVDPFKMNDEQWRSIWDDACKGIVAIHKQGTDGIVLVFNYDAEKPATWFEAPAGFEGPVTTHSSGKFHFAVYCTAGIKDGVQNVTKGLGWRKMAAIRLTGASGGSTSNWHSLPKGGDHELQHG